MTQRVGQGSGEGGLTGSSIPFKHQSGLRHNIQPNGKNKRLFAAAYFRATRNADGCVVCNVWDIDGSEYEGRVQVGPPKFGDGLYECNAVMSVTIIDGELAATGS